MHSLNFIRLMINVNLLYIQIIFTFPLNVVENLTGFESSRLKNILNKNSLCVLEIFISGRK